jgi:hypothetical protein
MGNKDAKAKRAAGEVTDLAQDTAHAAESQAREAVEQVEGEARDLAVRAAIREAPYAALGLGNVMVETARGVEAPSLPQRLLQTPVAVVSRVRDLGTSPQVTYLVLAARGRGVRLQAAGEQVTSETAKHTNAAAEHAKGAATATRDGAEEAAERTGGAAEAAGGRATSLLGKATGVATRRPKTDETQDDADSGSPAEDDGSTVDTGTGVLENRTVAQPRNRARELDIEGRAGMKKEELVQAIRDAT